MSKTNAKKKSTGKRPRILVLEGYSAMAANAVKRQGADVVKLNPTAVDQIERALFLDAGFDGLLLTGGGDVDPREYGEKPHRKVYGVNEQRDYCELLALDFAKEAGIPVLGICRGSQLMAVHNGGKLTQHVEGHRGMTHWHFAEPGSLFRRVIGSQEARFQSLHHQVVRRTGDGWRVAARDKDGRIEAVESKDGRCLGVQFHPELDTATNEASRRIFRWLVVEAAERAKLPVPSRRKAPKAKPKAKSSGQLPSLRELQRAGFIDAGSGGATTTGKRAKPRTTVPSVRNNVRQLHVPDAEARRAARRGRAPVKVSYICGTCGMRFDDLRDKDDHEQWLHGSPVYRLFEPPPGHPDWD